MLSKNCFFHLKNVFFIQIYTMRLINKARCVSLTERNFLKETFLCGNEDHSYFASVLSKSNQSKWIICGHSLEYRTRLSENFIYVSKNALIPISSVLSSLYLYRNFKGQTNKLLEYDVISIIYIYIYIRFKRFYLICEILFSRSYQFGIVISCDHGDWGA